jgi:hypothetical protein
MAEKRCKIFNSVFFNSIIQDSRSTVLHAATSSLLPEGARRSLWLAFGYSMLIRKECGHSAIVCRIYTRWLSGRILCLLTKVNPFDASRLKMMQALKRFGFGDCRCMCVYCSGKIVQQKMWTRNFCRHVGSRTETWRASCTALLMDITEERHNLSQARKESNLSAPTRASDIVTIG